MNQKKSIPSTEVIEVEEFEIDFGSTAKEMLESLDTGDAGTRTFKEIEADVEKSIGMVFKAFTDEGRKELSDSFLSMFADKEDEK